MNNVPQLEIDSGLFMQIAERVINVMSEKMRSKDPDQVRAAIALSDITGASVNAQATPMWWNLVSEPILDSLVEKELADVYIEPMEPGGRNLNKLSWTRTALRATGSAHSGENPTLGSTPCVPINMHSYVVIDEAALRAMMYRFKRTSLTGMDVNAEMMAENALFIRTWVYAALASLINLSWNGDSPGGAAGLNIYDGWLKQMKTGGHADTTAGTDLLGTVFPAMWNHAGFEARHLDMADVKIYTSRLNANRYKQQVLANKLDARGSVDPVTGKAMFLNAQICPVTDMPVTNNGSNILAVLTRRANMVIGLVDQPMKIDYDRILASRSYEFSSPIQARSVVPDTSACVYWMPA